MTYQLPPLPIEYDALEPFIDEKTMHFHHDKHHQTYVDNLNKALEKYPELQEKTVEELLQSKKIPEEIRIPVARNAGQHWNHSFFFSILKKGTTPHGEILKEINKKFGSFDNFKTEFTKSSTTLFGSGWVWLVYNKGKLEILQTPNHETPITNKITPVLVLDVWEHAYYLKYQNRRAEYIEAFFNVINWDKVEECFNACK